MVKRGAAPGAGPGTVVAPDGALAPRIDVLAYSPHEIVEVSDIELDHLGRLRDAHPVLWVNVTGFGDVDTLIAVGELFGLHGLALEDVVNTHQRPKVEEFDDHLFLVVRVLNTGDIVETDQVSIFLGSSFVLTFQERPCDCFAPVQDRIRRAKGRVRHVGPDYLCYALVDAVVDGYFPVLEQYGEVLEALEDEVVGDASSDKIQELHDLKRDLLLIRRAIWPHREMVNALIRDEHPLVASATRVFLRDCYDHTIQLMDIVETYREIASGLVDVYMSSVSARLNEIMMVLAIIATIFMPLSFIASLYGMNFDREDSPWNMPELGWRFGYPFALGLMIASLAGMLWFFRRRGWLGTRSSRRD